MGPLQVRLIKGLWVRWEVSFLFVFDKSVKMILEAERVDCKDELCSGAATQDIGVLGTAQILDTTKEEVWKNNAVCFVCRSFNLCCLALLHGWRAKVFLNEAQLEGLAVPRQTQFVSSPCMYSAIVQINLPCQMILLQKNSSSNKSFRPFLLNVHGELVKESFWGSLFFVADPWSH